jgi:hypothetical protein
MSISSSSKNQREPDYEQFEECARAGYTIIPLAGKKPLDKDWTARAYDNAATLRRIERDRLNAGIRIPERVYVLDPDVLDAAGNCGTDSYENLCLDIGFDDAPFHRVRSGGNGKHVYGLIPPGFATVTNLGKAGYPGVQARRIGGQMVLPGSVHPETGRLYRWEDGSPDWSTPLRTFPESLLAIIAAPKKTAHDAVEGEVYSTDQIEARLACLDPIDFREYEPWLATGMAIKHAGGDEAFDVWQRWNERDPNYSDSRDKNAAHWASFDCDGVDGITYRTLDWIVREAGHGHRFAAEDFEGEPLETNLPPESRTDGFKLFPKDHKRKGQIVDSDQDNVRVALRRLGARVSYNEFSDRIIIEGLPGFGPHLDDAAMDRLWLKTDETFRFRPSLQYFETVVRDAARRTSFHPVRDYLARVQAKWDGKPRLDSWLIDYAGAEDTSYVRAVSALPVIAAARRVRHPGCKYDEMLVLESGQGKDKSSALEVMAVEKEWFSDSMPLSADNKLVIESLSGKLIVECADLHGLSRTSVDHVKALLSRTVDRARMSYGRAPIERPRQNVFIGTANNRDYLRDKTGNRRFWPVAVKAFDLDALRLDRDQLWGEAAAREATGESIRLDRSLWTAAAIEQRKRTDTVSDPFTEALRSVLGDMRGKLSAEDVWTILGLTTPGHRTQVHNDRLGAAMRHLGWERRGVKIDGRRKPGYVRGKQPFKRIVVSRFNDRDVSAEYDAESE